PPEHIASQPASPRDTARMMVVGDELKDLHIADLVSFLRSGDVMVFNDTKVIPARLIGVRGNAKIELLLHKRITHNNVNDWKCFAKPAKKLRIGDVVVFADDFRAEVIEKYDDGQLLLNFAYTDEIFQQKLEHYGAMPLPPYIERTRHADKSDNSNYQTIYAENSGSVAAPTAGLHFTKKLLAAIDAVGVKRVHITLHVGGGTFLPVKVEDTQNHIMHSEYAVVTKEAAEIINKAKQAGGRVIAVGTTSVRTLESATNEQGFLQEFAGETNIFITPSYHFKLVEIILTNFHLPKSTLFMLVSAFSGLEKMQAAYAHAIRENYRFYSYGDACLLITKNNCSDS
ncbi:MAG: tRNA preQ1(34) S-adenosylmethionine ribosyltransferase-isomerase QueA, partial [Rickettsiales bacterium]